MTYNPDETSVWTSREVHFKPFPRELEYSEPLMDYLCLRYWSNAGWRKRWFEPGVASTEGTVELTGIPWYVPLWYMRRRVAAMAAEIGLGGSAYVVVERTVLTPVEFTDGKRKRKLSPEATAKLAEIKREMNDDDE